jgi:hypothetical protein
MDSNFVKQLLELGSTAKVVRAMENRRAEILTAIENGELKPSPELMTELAELNVAIGDTGVEVGNE